MEEKSDSDCTSCMQKCVIRVSDAENPKVCDKCKKSSHPPLDWKTEAEEYGWLRKFLVICPDKLMELIKQYPDQSPMRYIVHFPKRMTAPVALGALEIRSGKDLWFHEHLHNTQFVVPHCVVSKNPRHGDATAALSELWRVAKPRGFGMYLSGPYNDGSRALIKKMGMTKITWAHNDVACFVFLPDGVPALSE